MKDAYRTMLISLRVLLVLIVGSLAVINLIQALSWNGTQGFMGSTREPNILTLFLGIGDIIFAGLIIRWAVLNNKHPLILVLSPIALTALSIITILTAW